MKAIEIDLNKHLFKDALIFTGRDRGVQVRADSKINELEAKSDAITIIVPKDIITISPSFLEEFFYDVVKKLGKDKFNEKFKFDNPGEYKIGKNLETAIRRILRSGNSLR